MDEKRVVVEDATDNMLSGGLLVVMGIVVALVVGAILFKDRFSSSESEIRVVEVPVIQQVEPAAGTVNPNINNTPAAQPQNINIQTPPPVVNVQSAPPVNVQVPAPNVNLEQQEPAAGNTTQQPMFDSYNGASAPDNSGTQEVYPTQ